MDVRVQACTKFLLMYVESAGNRWFGEKVIVVPTMTL